jgi:hypothetical protein
MMFFPSRAIRILAVITGIALLTSCSRTPSGGISSETASDRIEAATGFRVDYIDAHKSRDGFTESRNIVISVTASGKSNLMSPQSLVEYLERMAWAVNDFQPNLFITVIFKPIDDDSPNWLEAARTAGLDPEESPQPNYVTLTVESATKAFGPWPGPVPELPSQRDDQKTK